MMEGSSPDFNDKQFCDSLNMPTRNGVTVDRILNEMVAYEKKGVNNFYLEQNLHD